VRQLTYVEPGVVRWREVPDPVLADPAGALVTPLAVARCDLDLPMAAQGLFPGPFGVGHETVAEVVDVGPEVTRVRVGQRVLVPYQVSCGACAACADRRYGGCHTYRAPVGGAFGFGPAGGGHGGGLCDLLLVPAADHLLVPAPDGIAPEILCTLVDNGVDGYRTVAGQLAAAPGADAQLQEGPWPRSFERAAVTVENTMEPDGLACTLRSTDDYGYCTSVAIHFAEMTPLPLLHMYTKGITLHLSRADSRRFLPEVIDLVASGRLDPSLIPTRVVGWEDAAEAWLQPAVKLVASRSA
jgi:threonine dehydrogenase-like Zn-dependent dehydrogenase